MGVVYKSFDPIIRRPIALKTIRKELLDEEDEAAAFAARFRNEAQAAGRLLHPGIVAVYEYGEDSQYAFIAMEFVEGASLRQYFERKVKFEVRDVVSIMAQLLDALQYAHDRGVWHRDIKPGNIIIMSNGRVKIADFGIARVESSKLTQVGVLMGTPGFIAPEQYLGKAVDHRIDVFAAGVVMYELLCGETPFSGSKEGVMYKVCHEQPQPPSVLRADEALERFDTVTLRALAKRPDDRYPSAADFRTELLSVYDRPPSPTVSHQTLIQDAGAGDHGDASASRSSSRRSSAGAPAPAALGSSGAGHRSTMSTQMLIDAGWNVQALAGIEHSLARFVGPIARVVVRRGTREARDLVALANRVAQQIASEADRAKFFKEVAPFMSSGAAEHVAPAEDDQATLVPAAHTEAEEAGPTPKDVEKATRLLTEYMGPIAKIMVRQAAKKPGVTRHQFLSNLAGQIGNELKSERFLRDFER
jgi:tRNA A-37 threonylcarbamoyl transferase component Bud32